MIEFMVFGFLITCLGTCVESLKVFNNTYGPGNKWTSLRGSSSATEEPHLERDDEN